MYLSAMTTCSSAALPARSPRPPSVTLTQVAPPWMPAIALATAIPKSLCVCISTSRPVCSHQLLDHLVRGQRLHDADGVAEAEAIGALGLGGCGVLQQEAELGSGGILGVDGDVHAFALGVGGGLADRVQDPRTVLHELGLDVDVAGGERDGHGVHAAVDGGLDVGDVRPVPAEDRGVQAEVRDLRDDLGLVAAHDRDAGLDLLHADLVEVLGDLDLLGVGEHDAGGLLAVTQRRVVELDRPLSEIALDRQLPDLRVFLHARTSSYHGSARDALGGPESTSSETRNPAGTLKRERSLYRSAPTVSGGLRA